MPVGDEQKNLGHLFYFKFSKSKIQIYIFHHIPHFKPWCSLPLRNWYWPLSSQLLQPSNCSRSAGQIGSVFLVWKMIFRKIPKILKSWSPVLLDHFPFQFWHLLATENPQVLLRKDSSMTSRHPIPRIQFSVSFFFFAYLFVYLFVYLELVIVEIFCS